MGIRNKWQSIAVPSSVVDALPDSVSGLWRPRSKQTATESSFEPVGPLRYLNLRCLRPLQKGKLNRRVISRRKCSFHILFSQHNPSRGDVWEYYKAIGAEKSQLSFPIEAGDSSFSPRGRSSSKEVEFSGRVTQNRFQFLAELWNSRKIANIQVAQLPVDRRRARRRGRFGSHPVLRARCPHLGDGEYEEWLRPDEKAAEPDPAAHANDDGALPLANYDEMTVTSLSAWLGALPVGQLNRLIEYENSHAARPDVLAMLKQHRPPEPYLQRRWIQDRSKREG